jgi:hypothetical protein
MHAGYFSLDAAAAVVVDAVSLEGQVEREREKREKRKTRENIFYCAHICNAIPR